MCTYNAISSHTDHYEIQKRDSEESLLTFVNVQLYSGARDLTFVIRLRQHHNFV